ncbi:MAG TPA: twin-arginine translocase TatA/TatE family subunit [Clostridiales bacterium]|nr:twin-arginine translocase TatA/TatE family subunit [Clostridiales bacterium]
MFSRLGPLELVIIFVIILMILGPHRLVGAGKALGRAIGEFRRAAKEPEAGEAKPEAESETK